MPAPPSPRRDRRRNRSLAHRNAVVLRPKTMSAASTCARSTAATCSGMTPRRGRRNRPPAQGGRHRGADLRLAGAEMARARQGAGRRQGRLRLRSRDLPDRRSAGPCLRRRDRAGRARRSACSAYLRYPGFRPDDLAAPMRRLIDLAERHDITVEIENEPVCNIGSMRRARRPSSPRSAEPSPWLRPLVDIGNSWSMGQPPTDDDIATLGADGRPDPSQGPRLRGQAHRAAGRRQGAVGRASCKRLLDRVDRPRGRRQHGDALPAGRPQCHSQIGGCPEKNCRRDRRGDRLEAADAAASPSSPSTSSPTAASAAIRSPSFPTRAA